VGYSRAATAAALAPGSPQRAPEAGAAAAGCVRAGVRLFRLRPPLPRQRWEAPGLF